MLADGFSFLERKTRLGLTKSGRRKWKRRRRWRDKQRKGEGTRKWGG